MKRDWCEAEPSDLPHQDNTKIRLESADQPHWQVQHGGSGAASHELPVPEQHEMKRDGCEAEASDSRQQESTKVRPESADEPHYQAQGGSSGAASHELPVPEQGWMEKDLREAAAADIPHQQDNMNIRHESVEPDS